MKYLILTALLLCTAVTAAPESAKLPPKEKFLLVLLAGQSNMAGRGKVEAQDKVIHPRVLMQDKDLNWVPAVDPVHYDKGGAGVGPGRTFGILLAEKYPDCTIGLIPTACGGSPLSAWDPGQFWQQTKSYPYDDMLKRAGRAMDDGTLTVILWHQGETDSGGVNRSRVYAERFKKFIARMRQDLNAPTVPLIIGELSQFKEKTPWPETKDKVMKAHREEAARPHCGFAKSDGLTANRDLIHFDAPSQREFGKRYFEAYLNVLAADKKNER